MKKIQLILFLFISISCADKNSSGNVDSSNSAESIEAAPKGIILNNRIYLPDNSIVEIPDSIKNAQILTINSNPGSVELEIDLLLVSGIMTVLFSIIMSFLICFLYKKRIDKRINSELYNNSKKLKNIQANSGNLKNFDDLDLKLQLEPIIQAVHKRLINPNTIEMITRRVLDEIKSITPPSTSYERNGAFPTTQKDKQQTASNRQIVYSIEPRKGNFFEGEEITNIFKPTESVYRIEITDNSAFFYVMDDPDTMKRAINYKKDLLDVACESISSSINAKKIVTEKHGVAFKLDNKWMIKDKAKIKFE